MKKVIAVALLLALAVPAFAGPEGTVEYTGGSVPTLRVGDYGSLDTTAPAELIFNYANGRSSGKVAIPYSAIRSYQQYDEPSHPLGAIATLVVILAKQRDMDHYLRINYVDSAGTQQVAIFELPRGLPDIVGAVLKAKVEKTEARTTPGCQRGCDTAQVAQGEKAPSLRRDSDSK